MTDFIPVNTPYFGGNERPYIDECIDTGWVSSEGAFVARFEDAFSKRVQRKHGVAVSNGTAALDIAVAALCIGKGDEVIMPTFTIISCASAAVRAGAVPVLVDCAADTWNMNVAEIEAKVTSRTRAIMAVHIYGLPVDMEPLLAIADKHGLAVIEDAAEMIGQEYQGKPCGSFGNISTFSFYPNKHITTGEGGMCVTDDEQLAERCKSLRNLCFQPQKRFIHEELGWNFRMSNLQAAVGLAQLEKLDDHIIRKRRMGQRYTELLKNVPELQLPLTKTDYAENIYWVYGLVLGDNLSLDAGDIMRRLAEKKIGTRPFFWPMHEQPVFERMGLFAGESYPVAERIARRGFYVPSGLALIDDQIEKVVSAIRNIL